MMAALRQDLALHRTGADAPGVLLVADYKTPSASEVTCHLGSPCWRKRHVDTTRQAHLTAAHRTAFPSQGTTSERPPAPVRPHASEGTRNLIQSRPARKQVRWGSS